jgi:FkbM family methyltransferase
MTAKRRILFLDEIPRGRPIYIYGTGANGRALRTALAAARFDEIAAFLDTNTSGVVDGLRCFSLADYLHRRRSGDLILLASEFATEIEAALLRHGIPDALDVGAVFSVLLHHELASEERFLRLHQPAGIAFDIGANAGLVARLLRRRASEVHAFEPNQALRPGLERCFAGFDGFFIVDRAVTDHEGEATFHISGDRNGAESSLSPNIREPLHEVRVQTTTIDAYCAETGVVPSMIKIDVEGLEPTVIRGGWETISRHRPMLLLEFGEAASPQTRDMLMDLTRLYRVVRVPWLGDPDYDRGYVDAVEYYRERSPTGGIINLGCLPLAN